MFFISLLRSALLITLYSTHLFDFVCHIFSLIQFLLHAYTHTRTSDSLSRTPQLYDRERFVTGGFQHHELYFIDGGIPPEHILTKFLDLSEASKGGQAEGSFS